ncbi:MAG: hypothetical protein Fur0041_13330 [Bacteroidia bacterium]
MNYSKFKYWSDFTIVRWQMLLSVLLFGFAFYWLYLHYGAEDSDLWIVMKAWLPILLWTFLILSGTGIILAVAFWLMNMSKASRRKIGIKVFIDKNKIDDPHKTPVTVRLTGIIKPLPGSVRVRIIFNNNRMSGIIYQNRILKRNRFFLPEETEGTGLVSIADRGWHDIHEIHLMITDIFHLVSFPIVLPYSGSLLTLPVEKEQMHIVSNPQTTEEQVQRIEIPKRVEGEYLNYKNFESGDDFRRIVWKIYARSGELVVRIPETMDPYASKLLIYASFHAPGAEKLKNLFQRELLNQYKDILRKIYESLCNKGFETQIVFDQQVGSIDQSPDSQTADAHLRKIAVSEWTADVLPSSFAEPRKMAALVMTSDVSPSEAAHIFDNISSDIPVFIFKMSTAIPGLFSFKWKDLVFVKEKKYEEKLAPGWWFHPYRMHLQRNESELEKLIRNRSNTWMIETDFKSAE